MIPASIRSDTVLGGDFKLIEPLSAGGMGTVFVAQQLSTGRRRAVKVMHDALLESQGLRDRFAREARVGSLIASEHVVEVVAAGVDPQSNVPWLAMELLEGQDLKRHQAAHGPETPSGMLELMRQICHAVSAAHAAGVVHRDLKPENVFIVSRKSAGAPSSVKVLDFGLAKLTAQVATAHTGLLGTPLWMAPEQMDSKAEVSPAADVWALGLIAFWMLAGRPYWRAASGPAPSVQGLLREILFDPLAPPTQRAAELGVIGRIPPAFDGWFARCVARDPASRFPNATIAFAALEACLQSALPNAASYAPPVPPHGSAVETLPAAGIEKPRRSSLGPVLLLVAAAALALSAVAGVILFMAVRGTGSTDEAPSAASPAAAPAARPTTPGPSAPTIESPEPSAAPGATTPVGRGPKLARPTPSAVSPRPVGPATETPTAPTQQAPEPAKRPFDHAAAQRALAQRASTARIHCQGKAGPAAVPASVLFRNDGSVVRVQMDPNTHATAAGSCVAMLLGGVRVPAFDGDPQSVSTVVAVQ